MKRTATWILAPMVLLLFSTMSFAGSMGKSTTTDITSPRASEILGCEVVSRGGESLGEVNDLIVGSDGKIDYFVVSRGGVMGVGDKLVAVPWKASEARFTNNRLEIALSKDRIASAPSFSSWDQIGQNDYERQVRAYYGHGTTYEGTASGEMGKPTEMERKPSSSPSDVGPYPLKDPDEMDKPGGDVGIPGRRPL